MYKSTKDIDDMKNCKTYKKEINMVNYIKNNLSKDEQILLSSKFTLRFYIRFVIIFLFFELILFVKDRNVALKVFFIFLCFALYTYLNTKFIEMAITNKRIILKKGIISTLTEEIRIEKCESVKLDKGIFGVFFDYGSIIFSGTGNSKIEWKGVSNPEGLRKQIEDIFDIYQKK